MTGTGARVLDVKDAMLHRLPLALALIAGLMFTFILMMTGRPVLAAKALVVNLLSLCATFGALVWVFQLGHLRWIVGGFNPTGATDSHLAVVVFCMAFGISMDYECMLLARITEEHEAGADTPIAIARGVGHTARLFTWSAAILAVVMAGLTASGLLFLKAIGLCLALAAVMDATLVRGLLVPAVMHLAGNANWWVPAPLRSTRRHPVPDPNPPDVEEVTQCPPRQDDEGHPRTQPGRLR